MAENTIIRTKRDGVIVISDSGAGNTYTVAYEPGDFSFSVPDYGVNHFPDRGEILSTPSIRKGDDQAMTLSFSAYMRDIADTAGAFSTLMDVAHRYAAGFVSGNWTSTLGSNSDVFTVTVAITIEGSDFGSADKTLTFNYVVLRADAAEGDPNTITVSGTSWALRPVLS